MNLHHIAQIAVGSAATDIDDTAIRDFALRFEDRLDAWRSVGSSFRFDRFTLTTRLSGLHDHNELRTTLRQHGLPDAYDDWLADVLTGMPNRLLEVSVTASAATPLESARVTLMGPWRLSQVWELLPMLGVSADTRVAYDRLRGAMRAEQPLSVTLLLEPAGTRIEVSFEQLVAREDAPEWADQLAYAAEQVGVSPAQQSWLRALLPALCTRPQTATAWTLTIASTGVLPSLRLTVCEVPVPSVLHLMADLPGGRDQGGPARLGALIASMEAVDDRVWRLHLETHQVDPPQGWVEIR